MKTTLMLVAAGAVVVAAQDVGSLPGCGQVCIGNMLRIATNDFGCANGDVKCYCCNANFGYGIRDCAEQSCSPQDAASVISFGTSYCAQAIAGGCGSGSGSSAGGAGSATDGGSGASATSADGGASATGSAAGESATGSAAGESATGTAAQSNGGDGASATDSAGVATETATETANETNGGDATTTDGEAVATETATEGNGDGNGGDETATVTEGGEGTAETSAPASNAGSLLSATPLLGFGAIAAVLLL